MKNIFRFLVLLVLLTLFLPASVPALPPCFPDDSTGGGGTATSLTALDYLYVPVEAGMDSVIAAPDAAVRVQGTVGSDLSATPANVSFGTFTTSGANISSAVWGSGTQTATWTISGLAAGKLYRFVFTPTVTGQVPTVTATSGIGASVIPAVVTATQEVIYFRATATSAVFTASNTATATWSTASTACYEYTRPAIARDFSNSSQQSLVFDLIFPADWNAGTITYKPYMVVTAATAPASTETIVWSAEAFAIGTSDNLSQAIGTAVTSTFTADATYIQYDEIIGTESGALTIANTPAAAKKIRFVLDRMTTGTYAQKVGLTGVMIKFTRTLAP